jgi:GNAT superfamily N-acetyltransferase
MAKPVEWKSFDLSRRVTTGSTLGPVALLNLTPPFSVEFAPPLNVLSAKGMTAYLVEEAGVPVATSFGVLVNGHVGVFNISTRPPYRRRGYARAATTAVLRDAYTQGARTAFLHCTPAGRGVYESLDFVTSEEWHVYVAP